MNDETKNPDPDDQLESLFKGVQQRPQPSAEAREKAFQAVTEEWEATQRRRATIIRFTPLALAATVLVGVFAVITILQPVTAKLELELAQGYIHVDSLIYRTNDQPLAIELESDAPIQAVEATRWLAANGADVRLDKGSTFAWRTQDTLVLQGGAVYIETDGVSTFVVETNHGVVRDIGTEFLVETDPNRLVVAIREGRIELVTPLRTLRTDDVELGSANVLEVNEDGLLERNESAGGARWNWIHITPKGYTTRNPVTLLQMIAEDLGKQLIFVDGVEASIEREELHGDYSSMTPWAALQQVMNVTDTQWREENGTITIAFKN